MPCYRPIEGFRAPDGSVTFSRSAGYVDLRAKVACGRCLGCRLERAREWAVRCCHEASLHDENCFITLTYSDEYLPRSGSLDRYVVPGFLKRLRRRFSGRRIAVFYCGEYGDQLGRPHYHALLFGFDFPDKVRLPRSRHKAALFRSPILESLWPFGQSSIGAVCFESAQYVAQYSMKKVGGERAVEHYRRVDVSTGEVYDLRPEFLGMSLRPAIGLQWFRSFYKDVFPDDFVISRGVQGGVPRYYDKLVKRGEAPGVAFGDIAARRRDRFVADVRPGESSPRRLEDKRIVKDAKVNLYAKELHK